MAHSLPSDNGHDGLDQSSQAAQQSTRDAHWMQRCLALASQSLTVSNPNPRVGCVLVDAHGKVIGEGFTQAAGHAHAEVMALRDAQRQGHATQGATAYVSLEPCAHFGRTPPCCDALIAAGVARVVAAMADPNPLVAGQGFARLQAAGIAISQGVLQAQAAELNLGFLSRIIRKRPWVRLKVAGSLDGKTALPNGQSQWITGPEARRDGQHWRLRACAVLTGIGTVLQDDPLLNVRDMDAARQPHLVVVDSQLKMPLNARLLDVPQRQVRIYTTNPDQRLHQALQERGAQVQLVQATATGQVDLAAVLDDLALWPINELHVEAGATLNGALLAAGLVDEWLVYLAPKVLGQGMGMAALAAPYTQLSQVQDLAWHGVQAVGADLRLLARAAQPAEWLALA